MTPDSATSFFLQQGILGVIISVLGVVVVWQQKRIDSKDEQITKLQDSRLGDAAQYTTNFIAVTKETVQTSKDNLAALTLLQRSMDTFTTAFQKSLEK